MGTKVGRNRNEPSCRY